jgi:tRNA (guanine-N7-)-methyltransferase
MRAANQSVSVVEKPNFYGRRKGYPLRPLRQRLMDELLPKLIVSPNKFGVLDMPDFTETWLEIGFGAGEHLATQAENHPDIEFIGCEPYVNGIAALLALIERKSLMNIKIYNDDARLLLGKLKPASISKVFLLFSDPWPKKRHNRRRFINSENLDILSYVMNDMAELRFATDDMSFVRWGLQAFHQHPDFKWLVREAKDWRNRYADASPTRYEIKALKRGKKCAYLSYQRRARA